MDKDRTADIDWNSELVDQLEWHWDNQLRPRLDGLTDAEYFWQPVPGCWTISRRGESDAPISAGAGDFTMDYSLERTDPEPVTTIGWRLAHIIVGVFASRNATHFGGPPADYRTWEYAPTATEALGQLDDAHAAWIAGVRGLGADGLAFCTARRKPTASTRTPRLPRWCCISIVRPSITGRRSRCCVTCTSGSRIATACERGFAAGRGVTPAAPGWLACQRWATRHQRVRSP